MFKQMSTLFRGAAADAAEDFTDRHALSILRQQIRECAQAVAESRKAIALAIAQNEQEEAQHTRLVAQINELEARAVEALEKGEEDLAQEAAEFIAALDAERDVSEQARARFSAEIARLRRIVRSAETRLKELRRGQRLVVATNQTQKLRSAHPDSGLTVLRDAEDTLARLRSRQQQIDTTAQVILEMENEGNPDQLIKKLADAGCGDKLKGSADDVLKRLKKKARKSE